MNIDIDNFKELLKKSTLNFLIDCVQLNITQNTIKSKMISQSNDSIVILNIGNEAITGMKKDEEYQFNFLTPNQSVMPYLNLIDDMDNTSITIKDEKLILKTGKQKSNLFFCAPQAVSVFTMESMREDIEYFKTVPVDDEFIETFNMIKKVAPKFGKVYFSVDNNVLMIETTDKTNNFSNSVKIDIDSVEYQNMSICFDYKSIASVMNIIEDGFTLQVAYVPEQEMGMLYFYNEDKSEQYYLMSKRD